MALTFENLIAHNKRFSTLLVSSLIILVGLMSGLVLNFFYGISPNGWFDAGTFLYGAFFGGMLAVGGATLSFYLGGNIIAFISDARPIEKHDDPVLFNVVDEMAIAAGLPMPKVYAIPDESPNAFATGRDPKHAIIGITTGLRAKLSRDELQAVIAHEMAHIKNYDIRLMMLVAVFAGIIVMVCDFCTRKFVNDLPFSGRHSSSRSNFGKGGIIAMVGLALTLLIAWIAPLFSKLLQLAVSRQREYLADATAVQLCRNPGALVQALKKIALDPERLQFDNRATEHIFIVNPDPKRRLSSADDDSIWSTHPPLIKRISRISQLAANF